MTQKSKMQEAEESVLTEEKTRSAKSDEQAYRVRTQIAPNTIVTVKNGCAGSLVYVSKRTNERYIWEESGDEQDMEFQELKNARNSSKKFFENNWFIIDDPAILDALGVSQYYKYALGTSGFDALFKKSPKDIKSEIGKMSDGQKRTAMYRARKMIMDGAIDSIKVIKALEDAFGIELIEH